MLGNKISLKENDVEKDIELKPQKEQGESENIQETEGNEQETERLVSEKNQTKKDDMQGTVTYTKNIEITIAEQVSSKKNIETADKIDSKELPDKTSTKDFKKKGKPQNEIKENSDEKK